MTGTIDRVIIPGMYLVRDQSGRQTRATSQDLWRKGDQVTVLDGIIVGRAGKEKITATYEV